RTAVGVRADGRLLLVTVDGRQPEHSVGMSIAELAALIGELGAVEALNMDGGGSTTMVVGGRVVNGPSDLTGERPVGDALLLVRR
ncbi:MAG: phosphodiester glycosidase family protein, partial [Acidobacteria bacterium]|nr:phosphodiester glycosidase family protein [Acidobacteriota bacterium]